MKVKALICFAVGFILVTACSKRDSGDLCISSDKITLSVGEEVTVSNCGSLPPENYVTSTIDWGDGTTSTGLSGTHSYSSVGVYTIRAMINGDWAGEVTDSEEGKVQISITVQ